MTQEKKTATAEAIANVVEEIVADVKTTNSFREFIVKVIQSRTLLGLLVILMPFLSRWLRVDQSVADVTVGTLIILIGRFNPEIKPLVGKAARSKAVKASFLLVALGILAGGCAGDDPRSIDLKANQLVRTANASASLALTIAPATGASEEDIQRIEREIILPALAAERALLAELDATADAYTQALAVDDKVAIAETQERAKLALRSLMAVSTQLNQLLIEYQEQASKVREASKEQP